MNEERRQTIVKEIDYWSRSKLLPQQYCDFLLNLYVDPDQEEDPKKRQASSRGIGKAVMAASQASGKQWLLTFGFFTLISLVVLYFNAFHPLLQIGVVASAVVISLIISQRVRKRNEATGLVIGGVGMLLMLGAGMYILNFHGVEEWYWQASLLGFCSVFWIVYGISARIHILHLCGWVASLLVYAWLLSRLTDSPAWYGIQLYWLPLSGLFGWASWFVHQWSKPVSAVLFVTCALVWFMPELYAMLFTLETDWLQLQLLIKIALGGILLFAMRKKWIVWVA